MRTLLWLMFYLMIQPLFAQTLVNSTFLKSYPKNYIFAEFGLFASYDVDLYRINYTTKDVDGMATVASGLVCLPDVKTQGYPMLVYQHGTAGERYEVPGYLSYENVLPSIFTSLGFISIAPDYLGLGIEPGIHPYVHADSEAWAAVDMLKATLQFLEQKGYNSNKHLFLTGYSQGGHASMALHRRLEQDDEGFTLKAASHMSGPYSISTSMKDLLLSDQEYGTVAYLANVALSYNEVYGIFPGNDVFRFFKADYAKMIKKFAAEEITLWEMNALMIDSLEAQYGGAKPKFMIHDSILQAINADTNHIVNVALRDNDVYDWAPGIPTRLLYCLMDDQVAYQNSLVAEAAMKKNGSTQVLAIDVKSSANHTDCVSPAVTSTLFFFLSYLELSGNDEIGEFKGEEIYPNPASDYINFKNGEVTQAKAIDAQGRTFPIEVSDNKAEVNHLPMGAYFILTQKRDGSTGVHRFIRN
ncbi:MAG: hypothetical protein IPN29_11490 [Saprospiraceae bacterium]|nr:hypothetical protein [Saprospiraceae bacterium]